MNSYIDTHCHYDSAYSFEEFFTVLATNLYRTGSGDTKQVGICLVELNGSDWFSEIAHSDSLQGLSVSTIDACTLSVESSAGEVAVFRAWQVNSKEKVEVIVIGTAEPVPEKLPLEEYVDRYADKALVVFPWGVGKWLGTRGELISKLLSLSLSESPDSFSPPPFVLGDNGGRPKLWKSVPQFEQAKRAKIPVLPGSDALPVPTYLSRIGTYGLMGDCSLRSCEHWIENVKQQGFEVRTQGNLSGLFQFLREQIGLRIQKHLSS